MTLATILKLLHVFVAIWLITGLLGRQLSLSQAAHTSDIRIVEALGKLAGRFENLMVIPGSAVVFLLGIPTAWAQGWPLLGFLEGGKSNWVLASIILFLSMMPLVPFIFLPRGKKFAQALEQSLKQGNVTPELETAFADPVVKAAHIYELVAVALIIVLMVIKPF